MVTSVYNKRVRVDLEVKIFDGSSSPMLENPDSTAGDKLQAASKWKLDEVDQVMEEEEWNAANSPSKEFMDATNKIKVAKKQPTGSAEQKKTGLRLKDTKSPESVDDGDEKNGPLLNKRTSTVSFESSKTTSNSICTSATESDEDEEENLTESENLHHQHKRRRAAREVHSNRRMYLSRRMNRQVLDGQVAFEFSPLRACTLSFSPPKARTLKIKRSRRRV